jgi:hypothetical protein
VHPNLFNKRSTLPSTFYPLLRLLPSLSPSQPRLRRVTLRGGSARRRPRGHVPVRLPRWCPPHPPREWGSAVTKRSCPSVPPPCIFLSAPRKRSVLLRPGGGSRTCAQGPSWRTPATPAIERQGFFLNAKEEAVLAHWGERGLLQRQPGQKSHAVRPHLLRWRLQQRFWRPWGKLTSSLAATI